MKKKTWFILAAVIAVPVLGLLGIVALGFLFLGTAENVELSELDRERVIGAAQLAPYYEDFYPSDDYTLLEKLRYIDDSTEVSYEFDSPLEEDPYIQVTITEERNASEALSTYRISWMAQIAGINIVDAKIDVEEDNNFYAAGERSRFGNIMYAGEPTGHMFVAQQGKSVYSFTLSGFLLDDAEIWHELFDDVIAGL